MPVNVYVVIKITTFKQVHTRKGMHIQYYASINPFLLTIKLKLIKIKGSQGNKYASLWKKSEQ